MFVSTLLRAQEPITCKLGNLVHNTCNGDEHGLIEMFAGGGVGQPYSFDIGNGAQGDGLFTDLAGGTYSITVTDDAGNETVCDPIVLIDPDPISYEILSVTPDNCLDGSGGFELTASGGTGELTYIVNGVQNNDGVFTNFGTGTYQVEVQDENLCNIFTDDIVITGPSLLLNCADVESESIECFGENDGSITITAEGGTPPYTYMVNNDTNTTGVFNGLGPGIYTVSISDANDCTQVCAELELFEAEEIECIILSSNTVSCIGADDGAITAMASGGSGSLLYAIDTDTTSTGIFENLEAGNYTVHVIDAISDCVVECSEVQLSEPAAIVCNVLEVNNITCDGVGSGSIIVSASEGVPPYSYSNGITTNTTGVFENLSIGDYLITITDENLCETICDEITIVEPEELACGDIVVTDISCSQANDGMITLSATGGTAPYTFSNVLTTNQTGVFTNLGMGTYSMSITDAAGCFIFCGQHSISSPSILNYTVESTNAVSCAGESDGSIIVQSTGGTAPYSYTLGNITNVTGEFTGLSAGVYMIEITDANGCILETSAIVLEDPNALSCMIEFSNDVSCFGLADGEFQVGANGGTAPYSYFLNGNINTSGIFTNLDEGTYVITISDSNGCTAECEVITISQPEELVCDILSVTNITCSGASNGLIEIIGQGGTAPYSYTDGNTTNSTGIFSNLLANTYTITITDANLCETSCEAIVIDEPAELTCGNVELTDVSCANGNDGSIVIEPTGGTAPFSFTNLISTNTTGVFDGLSTGSYSIIVTDANGCELSCGPYALDDPEFLSYELVDLNTISCANGTDGLIEIAANGGTAPYSYALGGVVNTTGLFADLTAGSYVITITDANGCVLETNAIVLEDPNALSCLIEFSNDVSCFGLVDGEFQVGANGGTAPYSYSLNGNINTSGIFTNLDEGTYVITISDSNGCTAECEAITISQPEELVCDILSVTNITCFGASNGSIEIIGQGGTAPYSYTDGNTTNSTGIFSNLLANTYTITITDANLCETSCEVLVQEPNELSCDLIEFENISCFLGSDGSITATAIGGTAPYVYETNGDINTDGIFTGLQEGTYIITITDSNNCTVDCNAITLTQAEQLTCSVISTSNTSCEENNGSIVVEALGGTPPYAYTTGSITNTDGIFSNLSAGIYNILITDGNNCQVSCDELVISNPEMLLCNLQFTSDVSCFGGSDGSIVVQGSGGTAPYIFSNGITTNMTGVFTGITAGVYSISVVDADGCESNCGGVIVGSPELLVCDSAIATDISCAGFQDGTITIQASGGTFPYVYAIGNIVNSDGVFADLDAATYVVQIIDANGCEVQCDPLTINDVESLVCNVETVANVTCFGESDGTISLFAEGGVAPYIYSNGITSNTTGEFENLEPANYAITLTDANGCIHICDDILILEPSILECNLIEATTLNCFGAENGSITVEATGGTSPYLYNLNGQINSTGIFTGLIADTYVVTIIDANDCEVACDEIVIEELEPLICDILDVTGTSCGENNGSIVVTANGGLVPYTYSNGVETNTTGEFLGLFATTYLIEIVDANGCSVVCNEVVITNPEMLSCQLIQTSNVSCFGDSDGLIEVLAEGGLAPYTYSNGITTNNTGLFDGLPANEYIVTVIDANNCTVQCVSVIIDQPEQLTCEFIDLQHITCNGSDNGALTVEAFGGYAPYVYSLGSITNSDGLFTNLSSGSYVINIIDANGCTVECDLIQIEEAEPLSCNVISTNGTSCDEDTGSVIVEASGGIGPYIYSIGSESNATGVFTGLPAGSLTIVIFDANGCSVECAELVITTPELLMCNVLETNLATCNGADGSLVVSAEGGLAPYSYSLGSETNTTGAFSGLTAGLYIVSITDANDCTIECAAIDLGFTNTLACEILDVQDVSCYGAEDGTVSMQATGGIAPYSYILGSTTNATGVFTGLPVGEYQIIVSDANNCELECDIVTIEQPAPLSCEFIASTNATCEMNNGSISVNGIGGVSPYNYSLGSETNTTGLFESLHAGSYTIIISDANNCTSQCISLTIEDIPVVDDVYEEVMYCLGEQPEGIDTSGTYIFEQEDMNGCMYNLIQEISLIPVEDILIDTIVCSTTLFEVFGFEFTESGTYEVELSSCSSTLFLDLDFQEEEELYIVDYLCEGNEIIIDGQVITESGLYMDTLSSTNCDTILFYEILDAIQQDVPIYGGSNICINETITLSVDEYLSYLWSDGSVTQEIEIDQAGEYTVTVQDSFGCTYSSSIEVTETMFPILMFEEGMEPSGCNAYDGSFQLVSPEDLEGFIFSLNGGQDWQSLPVFENIGYDLYEVFIATEDTMCIKEFATTFQFFNPAVPIIINTDVTIACEDGASAISINLLDPTIVDNYNIVYSIDGLNFSDSPVFENVGDGSYEISAINLDADCAFVLPDLIEIQSLEALVVESIVIAPSCIGNQNGSIELLIDNMLMPDSIVWIDNAFGPIRESLEAGTYTAEIFAHGYCSKRIDIVMPEGEEFILELDGLVDQEICPDDTLVLMAAEDYEERYWYDPQGEFINSELEIQISDPGTYVLETYSDDNCLAINEVTISIDDDGFEGLVFLMSTEGVINTPIIATDFSNPHFENVTWIYDRDLITHLSSDLNHEVVSFDTPGIYSIGMQAVVGECSKTIWKEIEIFETEEELTNPDNHIGLNGFINEFKITPSLNNGTWTVSMSIKGNNDVSLFLVSEVGYIVEQRNINMTDLHFEIYEKTDLPSGIYSMVLMTDQDWRYINFTKI